MNKVLRGICNTTNITDVISSGSERYVDLIGRVTAAFKPFRDDVVLDHFSDYLEQRSWTNAVGYAFVLREHPIYSPGRGKIEQAVDALVKAIQVNPRDVLKVEQTLEGGHLSVSVAVICDVYSIGD